MKQAARLIPKVEREPEASKARCKFYVCDANGVVIKESDFLEVLDDGTVGLPAFTVDTSPRSEAKKEFKIGMAHVGYAYDFCVESKDRQLAEQVYRDLLQRAHQLSTEFGFSLESNRKEVGLKK